MAARASGPLEWPAQLCARMDVLIDTICPKADTNRRRDGVQQYVKSLIAKCFYPEQASDSAH